MSDLFKIKVKWRNHSYSRITSVKAELGGRPRSEEKKRARVGTGWKEARKRDLDQGQLMVAPQLC